MSCGKKCSFGKSGKAFLPDGSEENGNCMDIESTCTDHGINIILIDGNIIRQPDANISSSQLRRCSKNIVADLIAVIDIATRYCDLFVITSSRFFQFVSI